VTTARLTEVTPAALQIPDAARYVGMSESAFRALKRDGGVTYRYLNNRPVVLVSDLDALLASAPTERAS
jgi:hypothetical protein